jgi:peptidoglycan-N-acetylglucosamine deacetylase
MYLCGLRRGIWLLAAGLSVFSAPPSGARDLCWQPQDLVARAGEQLIRAQHIRPPEPDDPSTLDRPSVAKPLGSIRRVKLAPGKKLVALTFDLCEADSEISGYQGRIVDYLRANNIRATFFAGGKWMQSHEERAQQLMSDPLFEFANHGWVHHNLRLLDGPGMKGEIRKPQRMYEQLRKNVTARQCLARDGAPVEERIPESMKYFRFPFGACNSAALRAVSAEGLLAVQWDVSTGDSTQSVEAILGDIRNVQPGSIVLMHANGRGKNTEAALPRIVDTLRKRGFQFATISELLAAGEPVVTSTCYDLRPGDTNRYDALLRPGLRRGSNDAR